MPTQRPNLPSDLIAAEADAAYRGKPIRAAAAVCRLSRRLLRSQGMRECGAEWAESAVLDILRLAESIVSGSIPYRPGRSVREQHLNRRRRICAAYPVAR